MSAQTDLDNQQTVKKNRPIEIYLVIFSVVFLLVSLAVFTSSFFLSKKVANNQDGPNIPKVTPSKQQYSVNSDGKEGLKTRIFTLFAIGGTSVQQKLGTPSATASVEYFTSKEQLWKEAPPLLSPRTAAAAAVFGRKIFVFGGKTPTQFTAFDGKVYTTTEATNGVEMFDPQLKQWIHRKTIPVPWHSGVAIAYGEYIYLIGGITQEDKNSSMVFIYSPITDTWRSGSSMPGSVTLTATRNCSGFNNKIYCPQSGDATYSLAYDIEKDAWERLPTENRSTIGYGMGTAYRGTFFSIVATPYNSYIAIYNPSTDSLKKSITIPKVRWNFAVAGTGMYLFSLGGRWSNDPYAEVYGVNLLGYPEYFWFPMPEMIHPRSDVTAAILPILYDSDISNSGSIQGRIYYDANKNYQFDEGEKPAINMPILLETMPDPRDDVAEAVTDEKGYYTFTNLPTGDYAVLIADPPYSHQYRLIQDGKTRNQQVKLSEKENIRDFDYGFTDYPNIQ